MGTAGKYVGAVVAIAAFAAACGPIEYVNQVTRKAGRAVAAADAVSTDDDARYIYWSTLAREYLHQARREAAFADFQAANRFGRKAAFAAHKAREAALQVAKDPSKRVPPLDAAAPDGGDGFSDIDVEEPPPPKREEP